MPATLGFGCASPQPTPDTRRPGAGRGPASLLLMHLKSRSAPTCAGATNSGCAQSTPPGNRFIGNRIHRPSRIHGEHQRLAIRHFQITKLAIHQRSRHEMSSTMRHALSCLRRRQCQKNKTKLRHRSTQRIAVTPLERRTGHHHTLPCSEPSSDFLRQMLQPSLPVFIRQRNARTHLANIFRWMKRITFDDARTCALANGRGNGRFATTGHAHDDDGTHHAHLPVRKMGGRLQGKLVVSRACMDLIFARYEKSGELVFLSLSRLSRVGWDADPNTVMPRKSWDCHPSLRFNQAAISSCSVTATGKRIR